MGGLHLHGLHDREQALAGIREVYTVLQRHLDPPDCSGCCGDHTPVCSYSEAEYLISAMTGLPIQQYGAILNLCHHWLLLPDGPPEPNQAEVKRLRGLPCPFLNQRSGHCMLPVPPLECWLRFVSWRERQLAEMALVKAVSVYPQKTGFVPAQLYALARKEDFMWEVEHRRINGAKAATGTISPLVTA